MGKAKKEKTFKYERTCSRCGGTGDDPEIADCACDCCEDGKETLTNAQAEALNYPGVKRIGGRGAA